jgi:hypothetical protein
MVRISSIVLSVISLLLAAPSPVWAAEVALTGKGEASYTKKKDAMNAREDAIEEATKQAVRKSLTQYVTPELLSAKADDIEVFLETAVAMVKRTEIVKEDDDGKKYSVILKAYVDEDTLKSNLESSGFSMDVASRRTIAVLIEEYFAGDAKPATGPVVAEEVSLSTVDYSKDSSYDQKNDVSASASSKSSNDSSSREAAYAVGYSGAAAAASRSSSSSSSSEKASMSDKSTVSSKDSEAFSSVNLSVKKYFPPEALKQPRPDPSSAAAITKRLIARDARLADAKIVSEMRQQFVGADGLFMTGIADPSASALKAMELGAKYASDAVMLGVTAIVYNGEQGGAHTATATLAIRIVDTVTGDIVASAVRSQSGTGPDSQTAASEAARRLGDLLGQDLGDQLFTYWKKRDEKGIEVTVRIVGVTSTAVKLAASDVLSATKGAEGVTERVFDRTNGVLEFVVTTKRPLNEFKSELLRGLYTKDEFKKLEEEMSMGANVNLKLEQ